MAQLRISFQRQYLRTIYFFFNSPIKNFGFLFFPSFPSFLEGRFLGWEQVKSSKVFTPAQSPTQRTDGSLSLWAMWAGKDAKSLGNISKYLPECSQCIPGEKQTCSSELLPGKHLWEMLYGAGRTSLDRMAPHSTHSSFLQEQSALPGALQGASFALFFPPAAYSSAYFVNPWSLVCPISAC